MDAGLPLQLEEFLHAFPVVSILFGISLAYMIRKVLMLKEEYNNLKGETEKLQLKISYENLISKIILLENEMTQTKDRNTSNENKIESLRKELKEINKQNTDMSVKITDVLTRISKSEQIDLATEGQVNSIKNELVAIKKEEISMSAKIGESLTRIGKIEQKDLTTESQINSIKKDLEAIKIEEKSMSGKIGESLMRIVKSEEIVALTACAEAKKVSTGIPITFNREISCKGIPNILDFQKTGIFTCSEAGLYLLVVQIQTTAPDSNAKFMIKKNNCSSKQMYTRVVGANQAQFGSGTRVQVFSLNLNETICVTPIECDIDIDCWNSTLAIIKIK